MRFYEAKRVIAASPERIWPILTDARRLQDGTFGITKIEGQIAEGRTITLWSEVDPKRAFKLRVDRLNPPGEMVWSSGMPLGLFRGTRWFRLRPVADGTEFHMREDYTGPMAGIIFKQIPDLTASMEQFAAALAREAVR
ncbi:SRPBCC domain-containing protein [Hasllibacter sp. MH4015]|uniref:SRPBCC domain-containing protein n=1 Tax=Hasllibacter sp. MH4015 TaxID=2854029 RepID=UPI001CD25A54|nr:SRPBCC domain-containing protein [Hasllibacter sp. MH4015]